MSFNAIRENKILAKISGFTVCYFCLVLLCFRARLFVDALYSPAGSWLSFVMSNCDVVLSQYPGSGVMLDCIDS